MPPMTAGKLISIVVSSCIITGMTTYFWWIGRINLFTWIILGSVAGMIIGTLHGLLWPNNQDKHNE